MNGTDPVTAGATIVMLTGMPDRADLFLTKPFSPLRLLGLVDELGG